MDIDNSYLIAKNNSKYKNLFKKNLKDFIRKINEEKYYKNKEYCLLFPMIGKYYKKGEGLFVIGRATNGWDNSFSAKSTKITGELIEQSIDSSLPSKGKCVFDEWFEDYPRKKSSFWRVTERITKEIFKNSNDAWTHHIAYSNLFKIAPSSGGNPKKKEQIAQEKSKELIFKEIEILQPQIVLMITDWEQWAENFVDVKFFDKIIKPLQNYDKEEKYVRFVGKYKNSLIIITFRSDGRNVGNCEDTFVNDVKKYLKN